MKRSIFILYSILFINSCLFAQQNESVIVKAGTRLIDYFPVSERYLYPDFIQGKAIFTNARIYPSMFNYNLISGEIEFIKSKDTLIITDKKDLISIDLIPDTFYYHNGYLRMIRNGSFKVWVKYNYAIKDILKKGAMGTTNRSAASESYDYFLTNSLSMNLVADIDMKFQKEELYFFSAAGKDFLPFNKTNIMRILPYKKDIIKNYMEATKTDFKSREDLLILAEILSRLLSEKQ